MISPELLRFHPFFAGFSHDQIATLAKVADEIWIESGDYFFHEGDPLNHFYLIVEGAVDLVIGVTDHNQEYSFSDQLFRKIKLLDIPINTVEKGDFFGWSALLPPHQSETGARATKPSRVIAFNCDILHKDFEIDSSLAYLLMQKACAAIHQKLQNSRIEMLFTCEERAEMLPAPAYRIELPQRLVAGAVISSEISLDIS